MSTLPPNPEKDLGRPPSSHYHAFDPFRGVFSGVAGPRRAPLSLHWQYTREPSAPATVRHVSHWIIAGVTGPRNRYSPNARRPDVFESIQVFFSTIEGGREAQRSRMPPPICYMHCERVLYRCASWFHLSSRNTIRDWPRRDLTSRR